MLHDDSFSDAERQQLEALSLINSAGAGGYIGTELTKQLLICGYTVRATVRKIGAPQYAHLEKLSSVLPGKLELYEADMNDPNCFEKAFDGAKYM